MHSKRFILKYSLNRTARCHMGYYKTHYDFFKTVKSEKTLSSLNTCLLLSVSNFSAVKMVKPTSFDLIGHLNHLSVHKQTINQQKKHFCHPNHKQSNREQLSRISGEYLYIMNQMCLVNCSPVLWDTEDTHQFLWFSSTSDEPALSETVMRLDFI